MESIPPIVGLIVLMVAIVVVNHLVVTLHELSHAYVLRRLGYQSVISWGHPELQYRSVSLPVRVAGVTTISPAAQILEMTDRENIITALAPIWMFLVASPVLVWYGLTHPASTWALLALGLFVLGPSPNDWHIVGKVLYYDDDLELDLSKHLIAEGIDAEI